MHDERDRQPAAGAKKTPGKGRGGEDPPTPSSPINPTTINRVVPPNEKDDDGERERQERER